MTVCLVASLILHYVTVVCFIFLLGVSQGIFDTYGERND